MAGNIHSPEAHEKTITSPEAGLQGLLDRVLANGRHAVATALTVLTLSSPVYAEENPGNKGAQQVVTLKDGRQMSLAEIAKLPEKEKWEVLDNQLNDAQFNAWERYQKGLIQAANQTGEKLRHEEKQIDTASNQMNSLFSLLDELLKEQGIQATTDNKYKTRAVIVSNVLANPILSAKFDQEAIRFLKEMETSLNNGKNPFAYMSKEGKAKLQALLKS